MTSNIGTSPWIVSPPDPGAGSLSLICFTPAGAGAAIYRQWSGILGPQIEVFRVQAPGRETRFREPLITRLEPYVDALAHAVEPLLQRPYAFFGHSMGALVAFALARKLITDNKPLPEHFMASAFRAPQAPPMKKIYHLPQADFIRELRETYDGVPDQLLDEPEILDLLLPVVRADLELIGNYQYSDGARLPCPITVFGGRADRWVDEPQLRDWSLQTSAAFDLEMFDGNHYYLNTETEALLSSIKRILNP